MPDSYLTAQAFKKAGGAAYNPADYPNHGTGLFFVGVEQTGEVIGYALDHDEQHRSPGSRRSRGSCRA